MTAQYTQRKETLDHKMHVVLEKMQSSLVRPSLDRIGN